MQDIKKEPGRLLRIVGGYEQGFQNPATIIPGYGN